MGKPKRSQSKRPNEGGKVYLFMRGRAHSPRKSGLGGEEILTVLFLRGGKTGAEREQAKRGDAFPFCGKKSGCTRG